MVFDKVVGDLKDTKNKERYEEHDADVSFIHTF